MQHKWLKAAFFTGAVALGLIGGQLNHVFAAADTDVPASMTFSKGDYAANTDGAGYAMVKTPTGSLNYLISQSYKDSNGNYAYCLEAQRESPIGQTHEKGQLGTDAQYRLFKYGFTAHPASDTAYWNIAGLTNQEAWYASQLVSWVISGNLSWDQLVWQASRPGAFKDGIYAPYGQDAVNRVKAAATLVYNNVMNQKDTANTSFTISADGQTKENGYHKYTYTVNSNQQGTATLNFKNQVPGMKLVDAKGNAITNNTVTVGQPFSILVPTSTPTGNITFDVNGNVSAIVPVVYTDAAQTYQDSLVLIAGLVKPLLANNQANWTRATGKVQVHKEDQDGKSLAGAEFTLTDNNGTATKAVTGKDGLATFTIAEGATYSLEETKTPAGYTGNFKQAGITLANDGQVFSYTAKNTLNKGVVKVHKVDQNGKSLAGAAFTLTDDQGNQQKATTGKDGLASFNIVANRTYTLEETKSPAGYTGNFKQAGITLANDGQVLSYTAKNTLNKGVVKVHKVDQNGKPLAGAEFTLTDDLGNQQKATTDKNGYAEFAIVANRSYTLEETKNPLGYHGTYKQAGITLANDGQVLEYTSKNEINTGSIKIHKVDQFGNPVAGAEFTLTDDFGNQQKATTDKNGYAEFAIVANRKYSLKETKTPEGYTGSFEQDGITLANDGQVIEISAKNNKNQKNVVKPVKPTTPSSTTPAAPVAQKTGTMPQTGDSNNHVAFWLGILLLVIGLGFGGFAYYHKRQSR
ncbi:SpaA isopeptide-forming pilin-related protein [Lacticaseibacillus rhamnosus]|uniref:MSCRAMM family protein n=1 Tax=Lactobacillales TaxID=186826 RepID=UPI00254EF3FD|nr:MULTISPECIES: SpaA isopeptide-forming pilin-related protein [Lactobacillales]MDK8379858.1 SpaA isopeptide-forming pilin-related protein [Aerococcus urinae]MDK8751404.1 SpaA isopeptide-forming pilin-related protein [Lacticaseibacillus rhamnosus]